MLKKIEIENFILYDHVSLEPDEFLTMIIGDSASGKSLLFKALNIFTHNKLFKKDFIKDKNKSTKISVELDITDNKSFIKKIKSLDIKLDNNKVKISNIYSLNKNEYKINNQNIKKSESSLINKAIFNILNQNTASLISDEDYITNTIDSLSSDIIKIKDEYQIKYQEYLKNKEELKTLIKRVENIDDEKDFIKSKLSKFELLNEYNIEEINKLEEHHIKIKNLLENKDKFVQITNLIYNENENSLVEACSELKLLLKKIEAHSKVDKVDEFIDYIESIHSEYNQDISNDDEEELLQFERNKIIIEDFKNLIRRFGDIEDALKEKNRLEEELNLIKKLPQSIEEVKSEISFLEKKLNEYSKKINSLRIPIIKKLESSIEKDLMDMGMKNARINFHKNQLKEDFCPHGNSFHCLKIKTTKESNFYDIGDIASGGEISRIMLSFFKNTNKNNIFLFDEVDTGLSGEIAFKLGKIIKNLSLKNQVLCITHLTQVACYANSLYFVHKEENKNTNSKFEKVKLDHFEKYLSKLLINNEASKALVKDLLAKTKID